MKIHATLSFLCILLQYVTALEEKSFLPVPMERTCIKQRNLNKDEIESVINEALVYLPEDNKEFNEFLGCYWKKKGYQDENGVINYDNLIRLVQDFSRERFGAKPDSGSVGLQLATKTINECKDIPKGANRGQTAAKIQNCITRYIEGVVRSQK